MITKGDFLNFLKEVEHKVFGVVFAHRYVVAWYVVVLKVCTLKQTLQHSLCSFIHEQMTFFELFCLVD